MAPVLESAPTVTGYACSALLVLPAPPNSSVVGCIHQQDAGERHRAIMYTQQVQPNTDVMVHGELFQRVSADLYGL